MKKILKFGLFSIMISLVFSVNGQIKLKDKLKKVESSVDQRTDQGIEKGLDKAQEGIGNLFKKKDKSQQDQQNQQNQEQQNQQNQEQNPSVDQSNVQEAAQSSQPSQPSLETYSKFDFIPGEKVIFYEDFSQDAIGDFPALWNTNGSAEVVTTNLYPGKWCRIVGDFSVWPDKFLDLPDNYTIEYDAVPIKGENNTMTGYIVRFFQSNNEKAFDHGSTPGNGGIKYEIAYFGKPYYGTFLPAEGCSMLQLSGDKEGDQYKQLLDQKYHISVWVQKTRVRIYQNEIKMIDLPKALPTECVKLNRFRFEGGAVMFSNIRVAVGAPDMRNKLMTDGKLVTYGIYFDVNKDVVKPESYGTLKEIAKILNEVPDVKVKINGHTDADGADAANLDLSKRRAASVKAELVKSFAVNGDRLETDGLGESQPIAPNDTPVNKALNRRVEFVKL